MAPAVKLNTGNEKSRMSSKLDGGWRRRSTIEEGTKPHPSIYRAPCHHIQHHHQKQKTPTPKSPPRIQTKAPHALHRLPEKRRTWAPGVKPQGLMLGGPALGYLPGSMQGAVYKKEIFAVTPTKHPRSSAGHVQAPTDPSMSHEDKSRIREYINSYERRSRKQRKNKTTS